MSTYTLIASDGTEHGIEDVLIYRPSATVTFRAAITKAQAGDCRLRREDDGRIFRMQVGGPNGVNGHANWKGVLASRLE